ncbi:hypothetical protein ABFS83_02G089600 [Erythranthe nasuta]
MPGTLLLLLLLSKKRESKSRCWFQGMMIVKNWIIRGRPLWISGHVCSCGCCLYSSYCYDGLFYAHRENGSFFHLAFRLLFDEDMRILMGEFLYKNSNWEQ